MSFGRTLAERDVLHEQQCAGAEGTWATARPGVEGRCRRIGWHPVGAAEVRQGLYDEQVVQRRLSRTTRIHIKDGRTK